MVDSSDISLLKPLLLATVIAVVNFEFAGSNYLIIPGIINPINVESQFSLNIIVTLCRPLIRLLNIY